MMAEWIVAVETNLYNEKQYLCVRSELVRCRDCKHAKRIQPYGIPHLICDKPDAKRAVLGFDYCSFGERKEDGTVAE